jgi:hypothetical protein
VCFFGRYCGRPHGTKGLRILDDADSPSARDVEGDGLTKRQVSCRGFTHPAMLQLDGVRAVASGDYDPQRWRSTEQQDVRVDPQDREIVAVAASKRGNGATLTEPMPCRCGQTRRRWTSVVKLGTADLVPRASEKSREKGMRRGESVSRRHAASIDRPCTSTVPGTPPRSRLRPSRVDEKPVLKLLEGNVHAEPQELPTVRNLAACENLALAI